MLIVLSKFLSLTREGQDPNRSLSEETRELLCLPNMPALLSGIGLPFMTSWPRVWLWASWCKQPHVRGKTSLGSHGLPGRGASQACGVGGRAPSQSFHGL